MSNPFDKIKPRELLKNQTAKLGAVGEMLNSDVRKPKEILGKGKDLTDKLGIKSQDLMKAVFDYTKSQGKEFGDVMNDITKLDPQEWKDFLNQT